MTMTGSNIVTGSNTAAGRDNLTGNNNVLVTEQRSMSLPASSSSMVVTSSTESGMTVVGEGQECGLESSSYRVVVRVPGEARTAIWPADQVQRLLAPLILRQAEQDALNVSNRIISYR